MKEGKGKVSICVLAFLTIVLAIVTAYLVVTIKTKNDQETTLKAQVEELTAQKEQLSNEITKLNKKAAEANEEKEKSTKSENKNEETEALIKKLLLEQMPAFQFQETAKDKYKVTGKYIDSLTIYSEPYVGTSNGNMDLQRYSDVTKSEIGEVIAIGTVTFTTEYDKDIEHDDVVYAGGSHSQMPYKNYVVQGFVYHLYKLDNGKYQLSLGTGGW